MISIDDLLRAMMTRRASDLHLKVPSPPVLRIDGELHAIPGLPPLIPDDTTDYLDKMAGPTRVARFHVERELDFAYSAAGLARFRVNASFQRNSIALAIRLVPPHVPAFDDLGLPAACRELTDRPRGLVLVTGPTGSGKSTTLAAMIDSINERFARHIVTIEDPIEYLHRDKRSLVSQREIGVDSLTFDEALRRALRQDPDVILLGELRDPETISTALTAAETGHLVFGTLHANSAAGAIDRMIDAFPAHHQDQIRSQLALVIEGAIGQALLPRRNGGRVLATDVLLATPAVRNLIREGKVFQLAQIQQTSAQVGMHTLNTSLADLVRRGDVHGDAALAYATNEEELARLIGRR